MRPRRRLSRIGVRLLAFNVLLVFFPAAGFLYLDVYERQLLAAQERSMVQQGRVLAAALADRGELRDVEARSILRHLEQRFTARLRVLDGQGRLLADSSQLAPPAVDDPGQSAAAEAASAEPAAPGVRESWLYRLGSGAFRLWDSAFGPPRASRDPEFYDPARPFRGPEVVAALSGRYGATTRLSPGQRSITLYSAIPVRDGDAVAGAVLVSQSTLRILQDLYDLRLAIFEVFLVSVAVAVVISLVVATTIVRPVAQLREQANAIVDRRGRLRGHFQGSTRDDEIGDLARALEDLSLRLAEHLRFTEAFAADVSHEFKNPLASIRTATEMLSETEEPAERRRFLAIVSGEVARLERLLSEVREVTILDAELEEETREPVPLRPLLGSLLDGFRLRFGDRVRFSLVGEDEVVAEGSTDRLAQVFENLLDNAVGFSPDGGTVLVRLGREDGTAVVRIEDEGPGVPPEHAGRVFDRFFTFRPDEAGARRNGHSGLGLSIVKTIVEGYGGQVTAGAAAGGGASFTVRLPVAS